MCPLIPTTDQLCLRDQASTILILFQLACYVKMFAESLCTVSFNGKSCALRNESYGLIIKTADSNFCFVADVGPAAWYHIVSTLTATWTITVPSATRISEPAHRRDKYRAQRRKPVLSCSWRYPLFVSFRWLDSYVTTKCNVFCSRVIYFPFRCSVPLNISVQRRQLWTIVSCDICEWRESDDTLISSQETNTMSDSGRQLNFSTFPETFSAQMDARA